MSAPGEIPTTWGGALLLAEEKARRKGQSYVAFKQEGLHEYHYRVLDQDGWTGIKRSSERGTEGRIVRAVRVAPVTMPRRAGW